MDVNRHIELATRAAQSGIHYRYRVGAVLVKHGNIVSTGANSYKTHPKMGLKTLHAEIAALIGVRYRDISGSIMFVSRINKTGDHGMARPCETCRTILSEYGIKKVYYTDHMGKVDSIELGDK